MWPCRPALKTDSENEIFKFFADAIFGKSFKKFQILEWEIQFFLPENGNFCKLMFSKIRGQKIENFVFWVNFWGLKYIGGITSECIFESHEDQMGVHFKICYGPNRSALQKAKGTILECILWIERDYMGVHSFLIGTKWDCTRYL